MRAKLELATAILRDDVCNVNKQGEVMELKTALEGVETKKARGAAIRFRVILSKLGNKCLYEFS